MSHYQTLQVHPNAHEDVIRAAYHKLAQLYQKEEKKLVKINNAKEILLDKSKRKKYDKEISANKKVIGNYKVEKLIAEGGFGRTYKGKHKILDSPVCLKQSFSVTADDAAILTEEAQAIWDLRHYGIPSIRDLVQLDDGSLILVMSYIEGQTLTEYVETIKRMSPEEVAWLTDRILNILKYLHFHGVVHGDIKPQNIIVQPEKHMVVLVDYGLSIIRPDPSSDSKGYTQYFSAPEQIRGGSPLIPEADFYSLGMTMIYALGGDILSKNVPIDTPPGMCDFIKQLIVHNPLNRPSWDKFDIQENFLNIRERDFGRRYSGAKR